MGPALPQEVGPPAHIPEVTSWAWAYPRQMSPSARERGERGGDPCRDCPWLSTSCALAHTAGASQTLAVVCRFTMGTPGRFCCVNSTGCAYTNLDCVAFCTPRLCGTAASCSQATGLHNMLLDKTRDWSTRENDATERRANTRRRGGCCYDVA